MDMPTRINLDRIIEFYEENGLKEKPTPIGTAVWRPTPLPILLREMIWFDILYNLEKRSHEGTIYLPGFGDGRRAVPLANFGYDVVCIDINPHLVDTSKILIEKASQQGIIDHNKIKIFEGNFLDENVYLSHKISFRDFRIIFAYLLPGNLQRLIEKVEKESNRETELFALGFSEWRYPATSLQRVNTRVLRYFPYHELVRYRKI